MFSIKVNFDTINIYIHNILYLKIRRDKFIGIQSWENENIWYIEFYCIDTNILCEFNELSKWKDLLDLIDKNL